MVTAKGRTSAGVDIVTALYRGPATRSLDWIVSASEDEMLRYLGPEVRCPRCGDTLRQDSLWSKPNLADAHGHTFSNIRALVVELYQRGVLRRSGAYGARPSTSAGRHAFKAAG